MIAKTLHEVANMAAELCGDPSAEQGVLDHAEKTRLIFMLVRMRMDQNISQRELAKKMGYTPSRLCRMEAGADADLKFGDILAYLNALGMNMCVTFDSEQQPAAHRIKSHVAAIHKLLGELCALARHVGKEDKIAGKINEFYREVLFDFLLGYVENYDNLPDSAPLQFTGEPMVSESLPSEPSPKNNAPRKTRLVVAPR